MGDRLGRYVVLRHLASGGMADVLLARTDGIEGFARHVVLKRIKPEHARDQRFMAMFLDEARLAANLHHGNIVQVFDIGESNGEYFFAMEYLHGEDLRKILSTVAKQRQHIPLGHVIGIVAAAAAGLHHAHERRGADKKPLGIVHRDVSPSNILVGYDGTPKLVDFGIAKAMTGGRLETHSGTLKGKVTYMSPEQCRVEPVDRRSDVYALGVVLYELATTTRLFKGDSDYLVMDAICNGKVPLPRVRRPELPNELSVIIMKALATDPARRYQTADELRVALEQFALQFGLSTSTSGLADYMHKLFGDKPEPWLDDSTIDEAPLARGASDPLPLPMSSAARETELGRRSWSDRAPSASDAHLPALSEQTITGGAFARPSVIPLVRSAAPTSPPLTPSVPGPVGTPSATDLRTGTNLAWDAANIPGDFKVRSFSSSKLALAVLAGVALLGVGAWKLLATQSGGGEAAAPAVQTAAANAPVTATPLPGPAAAAAPAAASAAAPASAPAAASASAAAPAAASASTSAAPHDVTVRRAPAAAAKKAVAVAAPEAAKPQPLAAAPQPLAVAAAPQPLAEAAPPQPPAAAAAAAAPAQPPAVVPVIEPVIAHLSDATVQAVARDHGGDLAKCQTDGLHGEITVHFEIDATGRVTKKQLSSTIGSGKGKVTGCILGMLGKWQFPKPPTGAASGSYTLSFQ